MCGIWTLIAPEADSVSLCPINHRGPDAFGTATFDVARDLRLHMASWRLAIVDLSADGYMPMVYDDLYTIVYNGEIYNHIELRQQLQAIGYKFRSNSDTEVILAAYAEWGQSCLERLHGMFAFCLWDAPQKRLFVARDRYGIKPLYFLNTPDGLACASEIKQFTTLPWWRARLNRRRSAEFLLYGFADHSEETMFEGVRQLRGGEFFLLSLKRWQPGDALGIQRWYQPSIDTRYTGTLADATRDYSERFTQSVSDHLRADVPIGSCLSGGMDSSAIVGAMRRLGNRGSQSLTQEVFASCSETPQFDERKYVASVAKYNDVHANYLFPSAGEFFDVLDELVWHQDEPFPSTSIYAQWVLFRAARERRVPVLLDGQGGDEQLQSYPQFYAPHVIGLLKAWRIGASLRAISALQQSQQWSSRQIAVSLLARHAGTPIYKAIAASTGRTSIPTWLRRDAMAVSDEDPRPWALMREMTGQTSGRNLASLMINVSPLPNLLHWEDRNSMAHSIEARVPFLDHRLVEFTLSLPDDFKIRDGVTKFILREATKVDIPDVVRHRRDKMGFATAEPIWFREHEPVRAKAAATMALDVFPTLFAADALCDHIDGVLSGRLPFSQTMCRLMTFGAWGQRFSVQT